MTTIPDDVRVSIVATAAQLAGPPDQPGWADRVSQNAVSIMTMADPASSVSKRMEAVLGATKFVATLMAVEVEGTSTRGVLTLKSKPTEFNPDGIEHIRTERTDQPDGASIVERAKNAIGHRILVYMDYEVFGQGAEARKMRKMIHFEDFGPDRFLNQQQAAPVATTVAQAAPVAAPQAAPVAAPAPAPVAAAPVAQAAPAATWGSTSAPAQPPF